MHGALARFVLREGKREEFLELSRTRSLTSTAGG
jgi:hypothetical protein